MRDHSSPQIWPAVYVAVALSMMSCAMPLNHEYPTADVDAPDIAGAWTASYRNKVVLDETRANHITLDGVETLVLMSSGAYAQIYEDGRGGCQLSSGRTWRVERRRDGHQYVMADSMVSSVGRIDLSELVVEGRRPQKLILCHPDDDLNLCFERAGTR